MCVICNLFFFFFFFSLPLDVLGVLRRGRGGGKSSPRGLQVVVTFLGVSVIGEETGVWRKMIGKGLIYVCVCMVKGLEENRY